MRITIILVSAAALLSAMCADITEVQAVPQSAGDGSRLIERMTRERKLAPATPPTSQHEITLELPTPVKRVPISDVNLEIDSKQTIKDTANNADTAFKIDLNRWSDPINDTDQFAEDHDSVASESVTSIHSETLPAEEPADIVLQQELPMIEPLTQTTRQPAPVKPLTQAAVSSKSVRTQPAPSFTSVPDIVFDPVHDEHTLALPDITDDGFIGVPRSQRDQNGQVNQTKSFYHQPQQGGANRQRVFPGIRRRFR